MLIFLREYMEMCFHGNQLSWVIKHPFISLYSKYHSPSFICLSIMLAPVISSLDEIYCICQQRAYTLSALSHKQNQHFISLWFMVTITINNSSEEEWRNGDVESRLRSVWRCCELVLATIGWTLLCWVVVGVFFGGSRASTKEAVKAVVVDRR